MHISSQAHKGHEGNEKRQRRNMPGIAPHSHLFGNRYFQNKDGLYIHFKCWRPEGPNGHTVILCHGLGEHCARYEHMAMALTAVGFVVYALDHQGHGASDGDRVFVGDIWDFVDDVVQLTTEVAQPRGKKFLLGHSMGGLIAISTALREPNLFDGLVLSGPLIRGDPKVATPMNKFLAKTLSSVVPKLQLEKLDTFGLARSETVVMQYKLDPLNNHNGLTIRIGSVLLQAMDYVQQHKSSFGSPFLIQIGTSDPMVMPDGCRDFFEEATSQDKEKIEYEGWYHEIFNECEDDCGVQIDDTTQVTTNRAMRDAVAWLTARARVSLPEQSRL